MEINEQRKEEYVIVLDYLPNGYAFDTRPMHKKTPIVQAIGKSRFVLLELVPKREASIIQLGEEVYIGDEKRDKIHHIVGKIPLSRLTSTAKSELQYIIKNLIEKNEKRFVDFFNTAQSLTTRMHKLELLPGVGKKHMWEIIEARRDKPFESFEDIKKRVKLLPDPKQVVLKRIMEELEGKDNHYIFVGQ